VLEEWLRSYSPEELFDASGATVASIRAVVLYGGALAGLAALGSWRGRWQEPSGSVSRSPAAGAAPPPEGNGVPPGTGTTVQPELLWMTNSCLPSAQSPGDRPGSAWSRSPRCRGSAPTRLSTQ
jgi:hypothetical protein